MGNHFEEKNALAHVMEKRVKGMSSLAEAHGTEMPGYLSAGLDAARDSAIALLLLWLFLSLLQIASGQLLTVFLAFGLAWAVWKAGRSGWLGWSRLERLHRLIEQEKYEIEHHRPQEREELVALYQAKGFEGKLLEDVVDVLMADQDRLLKVMLEEEMGLTLEAYEHPLQQSLGACIGSLSALGISALFLFFLPSFGVLIAAFLLMGAAAFVSSVYEGNQIIPAAIWNLSLAALSFGVGYFIFRIWFL